MKRLVLFLLACSVCALAQVEHGGLSIPGDGAVQVVRKRGAAVPAATYLYYRFHITQINAAYLVLRAVRIYDTSGVQITPSTGRRPETGVEPLYSVAGMSDYTTGGYEVTRNRAEAPGYLAWQPFSHLSSSAWAAGGDIIFTIKLPIAKSIGSYHLSITSAAGFGTYYPESWKLYGSNTGTFSGEEVELHSVSDYEFPQPANATDTVVLWVVPDGEAVHLW